MILDVAVGTDGRLLQTITLLGLLSGTLGSLFLVYDLLGRKRNILQWILRVGVPLLVGASVFGLTGILAIQIMTSFGISVLPLTFEFDFLITGALLGVMNGLFVTPGDTTGGRFFAPKDAVIGLAVAFVFETIDLLVVNFGLGYQSLLDLLSGDSVRSLYTMQVLASYGLSIVPVGVAAGIWRYLNRSALQSPPKPKLFSWKGAAVGLAAAVSIQLAFSIIGAEIGMTLGGFPQFVALPVLGLLLIPAVAAGPAGAIAGGISRYIFWWANDLKESEMQVIGVVLILIAFIAQAVAPMAGIFTG